MKISLNYNIIGESPGDVKAMLKMARAYGFDAIEATPAQVMEYGVGKTVQAIKETGIGISSFGMPFRPVELSPEDYESNLAGFEEKVAAMRETGCQVCFTFVRSSSDEYEFDENYKVHIQRWRPVAEILKRYDMRLALEFLGPKTSMLKKKYPFVRTAEELLPLCREIGDNCGLLFDFWHWYSGAGNKDVFENIGGTKYIYHVHLNDALPGYKDILLDKPRKLVGSSGMIDTGFLLAKLREYGYDGFAVSESFSEELKKMDSLEEKIMAIKTAVDTALNL